MRKHKRCFLREAIKRGQNLLIELQSLSQELLEDRFLLHQSEALIVRDLYDT
jgi:hypothetical protein